MAEIVFLREHMKPGCGRAVEMSVNADGSVATATLLLFTGVRYERLTTPGDGCEMAGGKGRDGSRQTRKH